MSAFEDWWELTGRSLHVVDARKSLAKAAFEAGMARGGNYVANDDTEPTSVVFDNGRTVRVDVSGVLVVGREPIEREASAGRGSSENAT